MFYLVDFETENVKRRTVDGNLKAGFSED